MPTKVIMPQLGESVVEGTVGRWLIGEGQPVKEYDPLLTVTTDKVDTEIPAPASGILLKILVGEGQTVAAGTLLAADRPARRSRRRGDRRHPSAREAPLATTRRMMIGGTANGNRRAPPLAQRIADENGVDLRQVQGSGPAGRITKEDVEAHLTRGRPAPAGAGGKPGAGRPAAAKASFRRQWRAWPKSSTWTSAR